MTCISLSTGESTTIPYSTCVTTNRQRRFANMKALSELARILQPAGVLGVVWNIDDCMSISIPVASNSQNS